jgi:seryl-tRNA(Sec) selenium transferase
MVILLRIVLIGIIIYLLVRSFRRYFLGEEEKTKKTEKSNSPSKKKISKEVGEYIDYEEIKD